MAAGVRGKLPTDVLIEHLQYQGYQKYFKYGVGEEFELKNGKKFCIKKTETGFVAQLKDDYRLGRPTGIWFSENFKIIKVCKEDRDVEAIAESILGKIGLAMRMAMPDGRG